jgi:hypothetical protein
MFKDHKLFVNDAPAAICQTLAGKVYECEGATPEKSLALTEHQEGGKTVTRFVSDSDCSATARRVEPNLEDVFLYVFRDETV